MPFDGEQLNDLLSGFVDGELTKEERALVEKAARDDARVGEQLEQLRQQSSWVQQAGNALSKSNDFPESSRSKPNGRQLAERVINAAKQRGREMGLPASHYLQPFTTIEVSEGSRTVGKPGLVWPQPTNPVDDAGTATRRRRVGWMAIGGLVSAAVLLIAVTWPRWQQGELAQPSSRAALDAATTDSLDSLANDSVSADKSTDSIDETMSQADAAGSGLVGKSSGMLYALVVDVEITADAQRNHVLEKILATSGIPLAPPIAANPEILKALDDSRMIVRDSTSSVRQLSIQVVRGDMRELDIALRKVWQDSHHFPNVALNLSIDSRATLMREMVRSAGDRFAPTDRFAMPLAVDQPATGSQSAGSQSAGSQSARQAAPTSGQVSPLPGADGGRIQYISKSQREGAWDGISELSGAQFDSMVTILLVVHRVE